MNILEEHAVAFIVYWWHFNSYSMGKNATECQENVVSGHSDYTFALLARHFTYLYSVFRVLNHGSPAVT